MIRWMTLLAVPGLLALAVVFSFPILRNSVSVVTTVATRLSSEAFLRSRLDGLLGQVGLDPLDPIRPLVGTQILGMDVDRLGSRSGGHALVRFQYADGSSREYPIYLQGKPRPLVDGYYTSLDRLFSPHIELPGLPVNLDGAPLRIGSPVRVSAVDALAPTWPVSRNYTPTPTWPCLSPQVPSSEAPCRHA